jgi:hypothetical protein
MPAWFDQGSHRYDKDCSESGGGAEDGTGRNRDASGFVARSWQMKVCRTLVLLLRLQRSGRILQPFLWFLCGVLPVVTSA